MNKDQIRQLARLLPENCGYFKYHPGMAFLGGNISMQQTKSCLEDPRFGWSFVMTFVDGKKTFPPEVLDSILIRTYYHLRFDEPDEVAQEAIALDYPRDARRYVLNAMLLCPGAGIPQIADWLGLSEEVIRFYEQLFFNVRDRLSDSAYLANIVWPPGGRCSLYAKDYAQDQTYDRLLLQAAVHHGPEQVLFLAGYLKEHPEPRSVKDLAEELEHGLLNNAVTSLRLGGANHPDSPAIKHGKALLVAAKKNDASERDKPQKGLEALSMSHGIIDTLQRLQSGDVKKRIDWDPAEAALHQGLATPKRKE